MNAEEEEEEQKKAAEEIYKYAANLLFVENKRPFEVKKILVDQGLDNTSATIIVNNLQDQVKKAQSSNGMKDVIWGAIWCFGGIVGTMADIGFIFWGAIVFGGFQLIQGLIALSND